ncbi:MAG: hypothetical protein ABIR46_04420 [Candidatus Saccharimonadales bacterium]
MPNRPRQMVLSPVTFKIKFKKRLSRSEFNLIHREICKTEGVATVTPNDFSQTITIEVAEGFVDQVDKIQRNILDFLYGNNFADRELSE